VKVKTSYNHVFESGRAIRPRAPQHGRYAAKKMVDFATVHLC